ncbi:MAG: aldo/keto reductase [Syntrophales bacterium]|nr:aldo/keto reductase [Syntrophales bacterium]
MNKKRSDSGLNRREFIKIGLAGTTSALVGWEGIAHSMSATQKGPFIFPEPVYRTLGRTGLKITIVSFGAMLTPEPEVIRLAFDHGVNYVDTARKYMNGRNEEIVARALKGKRDKVYVATKILATSVTKTAIFRDVETSLRTLETDHVDVIQLHNVTDRDRIYNPEIREALAKLKEQGKVRFFGVTSHTNQAAVLSALTDDPDHFFDTAVVGYSFKSSKEIGDAIARAAKMNIGVIAMKTQAGGYTTDALGPISPHQAALKWALSNRHITAAIPGMRSMSELREDISVMGLNYGFIDGLILKRYGSAIKPFYCHLCGQCEPTCPHNVAISTINRSLMYEEAYKNHDLARTTYSEIPRTASASVCLDCTVCVASCTNGLNISTKMERARELLGQA